MAKGKHKRRDEHTVDANDSAAEDEAKTSPAILSSADTASVQPAGDDKDEELLAEPEDDLEEEAGGERFGIGSYLLMNAIFWSFCAAWMLIAWFYLRETQGLFFFFGLLIVAFAVVSIIDYLYDRLGRRSGA